jgi:hypothetical protein
VYGVVVLLLILGRVGGKDPPPLFKHCVLNEEIAQL